MSETPLAAELRRLILAEGPIGVARYMALCLTHPRYGYYVTRDPLGAAGDFVTAPEISQIFGELLGLWSVAVWRQMGAPAHLRLVELGPGRGTLMADALRAARLAPAFGAATSVHLVEASPLLRQRQEARLAGCGLSVAWHADMASVPPGPAIVVANEFIDALPVTQFVNTTDGWRERVVGLEDEGRLRFGLAPFSPAGTQTMPANAPPGAVLELRDAGFAQSLCGRLAADGGAALMIDYGYAGPAFGDTLQAVAAHGYADPLAAPGEADLTAHVDFAALGGVAKAAGVKVHGPVPQGEFLNRLGLAERADRLKRNATAAQASDIDAAVARLAGTGAGQMGALFKAIALSHPALAVLPGFDT